MKFRRSGKYQRKFSDETYDKADLRNRAGESISSLAIEIGISRWALARGIQRARERNPPPLIRNDPAPAQRTAGPQYIDDFQRALAARDKATAAYRAQYPLRNAKTNPGR